MFTIFSCEDVDSITVSVNINGKSQEIGVYCGSKRPPMLMSHDSSLEIMLASTSARAETKGFKAIFKFVTGKYCKPANDSVRENIAILA